MGSIGFHSVLLRCIVFLLGSGEFQGDSKKETLEEGPEMADVGVLPC